MSEPCTVCGLPLEIGELGCIVRVRPHVKGASFVLGDEIDFSTDHISGTMERFRSRERLRQRMRECGVMPYVRHVGEQGSDKSKKTQRFV